MASRCRTPTPHKKETPAIIPTFSVPGGSFGKEERRKGGKEERRKGGKEERRKGGKEERRKGGKLRFPPLLSARRALKSG
jgi:hypothetical protein